MMIDFIAKKKYRLHQSAMDKIGLSIAQYHGVKYILVHYFDNNTLFGRDYDSANNLTELNDIKSNILNNGFKMDWDMFNEAMRHLS